MYLSKEVRHEVQPQGCRTSTMIYKQYIAVYFLDASPKLFLVPCGTLFPNHKSQPWTLFRHSTWHALLLESRWLFCVTVAACMPSTLCTDWHTCLHYSQMVPVVRMLSAILIGLHVDQRLAPAILIANQDSTSSAWQDRPACALRWLHRERSRPQVSMTEYAACTCPQYS